MGVTESKVLANGVLRACEHAERAGKSELDDQSLWRNEVIWKAAKTVCRHIPSEICNNRPRRSNLKKAILRSRTHTNIPQVVEDVRDKPEMLFRKVQDTSEKGQENDPCNHPTNFGSNFTSSIDCLASYYKLVVHYETEDILNKIRLRLLYVAFYQVKQKIRPGTQYEYNETVPFLAVAIFHTLSDKGSLDDIEQRLRIWIGYGERYSLIADDLGGLGALYILPDLGGEYIWTKELPKSATNQGRISMIQSLKEQNVHLEAERGGLHASAQAEIHRIVQDLLQAFQSVTNHHLSGTPLQTSQEQSRQRADVLSLNGASSEPLFGSHALSAGQIRLTVPPSHLDRFGWLENGHTSQMESLRGRDSQDTNSTQQQVEHTSNVQQPRSDPAINQPHNETQAGVEYLNFTIMTPKNFRVEGAGQREGSESFLGGDPDQDHEAIPSSPGSLFTEEPYSFRREESVEDANRSRIPRSPISNEEVMHLVQPERSVVNHSSSPARDQNLFNANSLCSGPSNLRGDLHQTSGLSLSCHDDDYSNQHGCDDRWLSPDHCLRPHDQGVLFNPNQTRDEHHPFDPSGLNQEGYYWFEPASYSQGGYYWFNPAQFNQSGFHWFNPKPFNQVMVEPNGLSPSLDERIDAMGANVTENPYQSCQSTVNVTSDALPQIPTLPHYTADTSFPSGQQTVLASNSLEFRLSTSLPTGSDIHTSEPYPPDYAQGIREFYHRLGGEQLVAAEMQSAQQQRTLVV